MVVAFLNFPVPRNASFDEAQDEGWGDATVILAAWLRDRGETDGCLIPLRADVPVEQQLPGWIAALDSMWSRTGADPNGSVPQLPPPPQP